MAVRSSKQEQVQLISIVIGIAILKFILLFVSQTTDPDAVVRIIKSTEWKQDPHWVGSNVWGPFNYYLHGIGLMICNDLVITPKLINTLLSIITILPVYKMLRIDFNHHISLVTVMVFALSPLVFRNALMAMTETPYVLFISVSIWMLRKYFVEKTILTLLLSGLSMTIAAGFRYEAWALMFVFAIILLIKKHFKAVVIFSLVAGVFPVIWLISNHLFTGDFLWSLKGNNHWTLEVMKTNEKVSFEGLLRRVWFIPFMFFIALGPVFSFGFLRGLRSNKQKIWLLPLGFVFTLLMYKSLNGTLLHHPRFAITLLVLSLPFLAGGLELILRKTKHKLIVGSGFALSILGSLVYNVDNIAPIPMLKDQRVATMVARTSVSSKEKNAVFIDFVGWQETYFIALHFYERFDQVFIVGGYDDDDTKSRKYGEFIALSGTKHLVLNCEENTQNIMMFGPFIKKELVHLMYKDLESLCQSGD
ncbi:ArnT family glycosyltransferase [Parvicella tangerina]|uniref:Glycosyltransferase RgtA/B/C/D-like domain-containing protein n=1 Tax=Parvicella tangerina TaxID=2829795 RepID=A0A916JLJ3_9FLAO|nr:glycosyltransferase family 39 protein [Parvicella tangerina]CAG5077929.1 hypothetical protein CRYO30217_00518 [Parvicella tangerina]